MENYNSLTGTIMKKKSGDILNPLTGQYRKDDESTGKRWPSISERSDDNEAQEQEQEPVQKNSDSQWPSLTAHLTGNVSKGSENFEKTIPIFIEKSKDEQIVYGIVYEPDTVDSQGDQANAEEIRKAAYSFMENAQTFKVMHKGRPVKVKILESYIAP